MDENLKKIIDAFKILPGIGQKNAERLAFYILDEDTKNVLEFVSVIEQGKKKIKKCCVCNNYSSKDICDICEDETRNKELLCVVEDPKTLYVFEKNNLFPGKYFVLNGLISPLDGINPEDIGLEQLKKYIQEKNIKEVVLALKQSVVGETTSLYIKKILGSDVIISKIASGIPFGTDIEYVDTLTLKSAFFDRKNIND